MLKASNHHIVRPKRTSLMRHFTETEKLQLQTKIDDKEQHSQTPGKLDGKNDEPLQTESRARRDGTLEIILFLTALSVILLLWSWDNIGFNSMPLMVLMVVLMLLFNHIAFSITKQGRLPRLMKTFARVWIAHVGGCLIWAFYDLIRLTVS